MKVLEMLVATLPWGNSQLQHQIPPGQIPHDEGLGWIACTRVISLKQRV